MAKMYKNISGKDLRVWLNSQKLFVFKKDAVFDLDNIPSEYVSFVETLKLQGYKNVDVRSLFETKFELLVNNGVVIPWNKKLSKEYNKKEDKEEVKVVEKKVKKSK